MPYTSVNCELSRNALNDMTDIDTARLERVCVRLGDAIIDPEDSPSMPSSLDLSIEKT
jgi:hypothetical protein